MRWSRRISLMRILWNQRDSWATKFIILIMTYMVLIKISKRCLMNFSRLKAVLSIHLSILILTLRHQPAKLLLNLVASWISKIKVIVALMAWTSNNLQCNETKLNINSIQIQFLKEIKLSPKMINKTTRSWRIKSNQSMATLLFLKIT